MSNFIHQNIFVSGMIMQNHCWGSQF